MYKRFVIAAASLAAVLPAAAGAVILDYSIYGGSSPSDTGYYRFQFQLDTDRAPSFFTSDTLRYAPTTVSYALPGSSVFTVGTQSNLGPSFFAPINQGGLSILRLATGNDPQPRFFGPALFSGTTADPTFLTGTYQLSTQPKNVPSDVQVFDYTVVIGEAGAVPEPASWALMITGFGLAGTALRQRRRVTA